MAHALRLSQRGLGNVWPNPAVGCVLVRDGRVVGRGWTQPGGRPHAERMALDQAGENAHGATAYVTLEPCAHQGRAGPCSEALIAAGVARVVSALTDPDPRTAGRGHAKLRAAGIEVTEGVGAVEAARLQRGFLKRVTEGLPMVTLKLATSLDGRIATASGESQWITGPEARRHVHLLRLRHDAIMVGGGTARADRPSLNVRGFGPVRQPERIVVSSRDLPDLPPEGPDFGPLHRVSGDPVTIMRELAQRGLTRIICEGGGNLAASLLSAGLVDDLVLYSAGMVLGASGRPAVGALDFGPLADAPRFKLRKVLRLGPDLCQIWSRN
ncbi:MAG TPA: bifunctional diaminohydroxyphosphoribosylaminopyrimidine deaminase/5-amino-6-(5-phosphoribosylamino)uracil reductase RibD [Paracoccus sp. (in: a-proteobacteria)]|uniref:bifunctional diaminohydroxyphosphoribosylaminopyrimidine deaminase/5-amino-6-(5-phosphoribosylamino)uracil reductase RibD n=1 Tax=uncultured Paracoccus sp. TaxID=189685 RepID=UPI0026108418|nr:bifunctional diaminohydroxyphosphoribosylaminopyrimidine deaminase/5-amino-6-(5-phosphoribosylamino)uracil reductase RibD [uncultured Paracoccus sp.]HMQ41806.1 bifunctional diaminohydroxyphosphoribosylaminopyrimidine deaminase/5-amino-6-(5-phosphoribosylamino)uracil reductase RibD [Paracoccus sp. (in: a-proteobacteria)]HMR36640.1 bifunctional diaminohydroxyphosphoribosylaminopyrimidine deaminase/5-amino-6-(5-phosphoribosylamino)uracil reductase RibD [Paracoccus sp. (in: a-proteobacteria)]